MINGIHAIIYNKEADKLRDFFRDVLEMPSVDAGHGWLIFALPPAELGIHPTEGLGSHALYLMCDDIHATLKELEAKGIEQAMEVQEQGWGAVAAIKIPGGEVLHLYQPKHPTALGLKR
jgi:hypothetical protein